MKNVPASLSDTVYSQLITDRLLERLRRRKDEFFLHVVWPGVDQCLCWIGAVYEKTDHSGVKRPDYFYSHFV